MEQPSGSVQQIEPLLKKLSLGTDRDSPSAPPKSRAHTFRSVGKIIADFPAPSEAQDAFRRLGGFEILIANFKDVPVYFYEKSESNETYEDLFELLGALLGVLSSAILDHPGSTQYFSSMANNHGWTTLEQAIFDMENVHVAVATKHGLETTVKERTFELLLTAALNDGATTFSLRPKQEQPQSNLEEDRSSQADAPKGEDTPSAAKSTARIEEHLKSHINSKSTLSNPNLVLVLFSLWRKWASQDLAECGVPEDVSLSLLISLKMIATAKEINNVLLHRSGLFSSVLDCLLNDEMPEDLQTHLKDLVRQQSKLGVKSLAEVAKLFRHAASSEEGSRLFLETVKASDEPAHFHFDLSLQGSAALEVSQLKTSFPSTEPSTGYTFMAWLRIDAFDKACHTTLFGLFDTTQTCFLLIYIERESRYLVLQTSVTSSRPSVRFKSFKLETGMWYHVAIAHRRPHAAGTGRASLFLNGELREHVKCEFPRNASGSDIQAFLGTPRDLTPRLGKNVLSCRWSLASACLFAEALAAELILVYQKLGPSYQGSFQDCLGSFQTYKASALLNVHNEMLHPDKTEESIITSAVRSKAGKLNPEHNALLNICASNVVGAEDRYQHVVGTSRKRAIEDSSANAAVPNGAFPLIPDALDSKAGRMILTGGCVACETFPLSRCSWRLSGCVAASLRLVELATSPEALINAVTALFELVKNDWRNSEAMERDNGFGILSWLLRSKLSSHNETGVRRTRTLMPFEDSSLQSAALKSEILRTILDFVGFQEDEPRKSIIVNPLAYRVLLVDCDIWRRSDLATQSLYYDQFVVFASTSTFREFNIKRLDRMRIMKKLIDALKGESIRNTALSILIEALRTLLQCTISADVLRSLALFITYSLHQVPPPTVSDSRTGDDGRKTSVSRHEPALEQVQSSATGFDEFDRAGDPPLSRKELGISVLEMLAEVLTGNPSELFIKRFAKTVTNKWLLHLFAVDESRVIIAAARILARLLVVSGESYMTRFQDNTKGFLVLSTRLRKWWYLDDLWTCCFAILLGLDVATLNWNQRFQPQSLFKLLKDQAETSAICRPSFPVISAMLEEGVSVLRGSANLNHSGPDGTGREPSLDQVRQSEFSARDLASNDAILLSVFHFLKDLHEEWQPFAGFALSSSFLKDLLNILHASENLEPDNDPIASELGYQQYSDQGREDFTQDSLPNPIKGASSGERKAAKPGQISRRRSSYVVVGSIELGQSRDTSFRHPLQPLKLPQPPSVQDTGSRDSLLQLIVCVIYSRLFSQKDFPGLGLFLKAPAGSLSSRSCLTCNVMVAMLNHLSSKVDTDPKLFWEPRNLTNISRLVHQTCEAVFEGWLGDILPDFLRFLASLLQYLQRPDVRSIKSVRLCSPNISLMQQVFRRLVLLRLSSMTEVPDLDNTEVLFLGELISWQDVLLLHDEAESNWLPAFCFLLSQMLIHGPVSIRHAAGDLWRVMAEHKLLELHSILRDTARGKLKALGTEFWTKIQGASTDALLSWATENGENLTIVFSGLPESLFARIVVSQNEASEQSAKLRVSKRKERLHQMHLDELAVKHAWTEHDVTTKRWSENIFLSETFKYRRARQDQQENRAFLESTFSKQRNMLQTLRIFEDRMPSLKWQLDEAEGRDRMRLRISPMHDHQVVSYRPKRAPTIRDLQKQGDQSPATPSTPGRSRATSSASMKQAAALPHLQNQASSEGDGDDLKVLGHTEEDEFELVPNPQADEDEIEDKNRKVMRSLQRGEQVEDVYNVSRIRGLEACQCLLIVGKSSIYFLDNLFQRADGEVVSIDRVPKEERDPYTEILSGLGPSIASGTFKKELETRHWPWEEVISISKRHFLLRDVAIEIFFEDGYSYLLTTAGSDQRNAMHDSLTERAQRAQSLKSVEEGAWRISLLRNPKDDTQTIGSKFTSVFTASSTVPATKRWAKREISNFQYLMLINTLAGRTFNDLTQYPVFPWVLADYSSEELDLNDPRVYRDLNKPMGCQTPQREIAFRDRYKSFAEMSDERTPPFHYGTHYSSAMIITSYLIRLQPFVQSYLLLQGGKFDHADRLFFSIEKAWLSASRETMTDVRELTPEFFYLPDFLINLNGYDFGTREGTGEIVNDVLLPPWAKGDPAIFIAKHREALESPYVTQNLHNWIDLVFGFKQRGEAALEATNVFHHLSYSGSRDLDSIQDELERRATIGIIHNFGQTPRQVFSRPHDRAEVESSKSKDGLVNMNMWRMTPGPIQETHFPVAGLAFHKKQHRILPHQRYQTYLRPDCNILIEWEYADRGIRFYSMDHKKLLGFYEQLHSGQIYTALAVDSTTLVTAGDDCTAMVWTVKANTESVEFFVRGTLFGHRDVVTVLAASKSFSTVVTCSVDGIVLVWDLIRLNMLQRITCPSAIECAQVNDKTGHILLCCRHRVLMYTLNGRQLIDQEICRPDDHIASCAFLERDADRWEASEVFFTGHKHGLVNMWKVAISPSGKWIAELLQSLDHIDRSGRNFAAPITSILATGKRLHTADAAGRVFEWNSR